MKIINKILIFTVAILAIVAIVLGVRLTSSRGKPFVFKEVKEGPLEELTKREKAEDFDYLCSVLEDSFPYFEIEKDKTGFDFLKNKNMLKKKVVNTKNNEDFFTELHKAITSIQNAHTNLMPPDDYVFYRTSKDSSFLPWSTVCNSKGVIDKENVWKEVFKNRAYSILPLEIKYIDGKYVIIEDFENIKKGDMLTAVNGQSVDEYVKTLVDIFYLRYDDIYEKLYIDTGCIFLRNNETPTLELIDADGHKYKETLQPIEIQPYNSNSNISQQPISVFESKILEKDKIAYLKIKQMNNSTMMDDIPRIHRFFNEASKYKSLIIDIRVNGGGDDRYWIDGIIAPLCNTPLGYSTYIGYRGEYISNFINSRDITTYPFNTLSNEFKNKYTSEMENYSNFNISISPNNLVDFKGKIYLLVDDKVYSSAESFAAFCKATDFATLIGITTGGDGIGIDPAMVALPNSGLVVRFSLDMAFNPDGTVNEKEHTKPDILVNPTYEDYINGRDAILERAIEESLK